MDKEEVLKNIKALSLDDLTWLNLQLLQWYGEMAEDMHFSEDEAALVRRQTQHIIEEYIV